jgi:hypothetical protein
MSGIVGGNFGRGSGLIKAGAIDDDSVTLAKMAGLARGKLIYGDASGDPAALAVGGANEVLTHDGTDFDWAAAAAGGDLSFGGDTFGANKVIGANDAYSFSLETSGNTALTIDANGIMDKPLQPCFYATVGNGQAIADSTVTTLTLDSERFDLNGDFDTSTSTFTAPVTGKYYFTGVYGFDGGAETDVDYDYVVLTFYASNVQNGYLKRLRTNVYDQGLILNSDIIDMDANDTCYCSIYLDRIVGAGGTTITGARFQGFLIC